MRKKWIRGSDLVQLTNEELTSLIQPAFPGDEVIAQDYTEGGLANTNICLRLRDYTEPLLLRFHTRAPHEAAKEHAILELIKGNVPAPHVVHTVPNPQATLLTYLPGITFEETIGTLIDYEPVGKSVGETLAAIHSYHFSQCGFFNEKLEIAQPITICGAGLANFAQEYLLDKGGADRLGHELSQEVIDFLQAHGSLIDKYDHPPCLTHSDFNPSNILIGVDGQVTGVLDWEFAFSGSPLLDFGNLFRPPVDTLPGFLQGFVEGYSTGGGALPPLWQEMSMLVDLTAWFDFMTRPVVNEQLIEDARAQVRAVMAADA